jgi:hypothetical protein
LKKIKKKFESELNYGECTSGKEQYKKNEKYDLFKQKYSFRVVLAKPMAVKNIAAHHQ